MSSYVQVVTTTARRDEAEAIAKALVAQRLAACCQVGGPILSVFRWKGKVETTEEWTCTAKTRAELFPKVEAAILDLHPYETPEIIALPIAAGHAAYLRWLEDETQGGTAATGCAESAKNG